MNFFSIPHDGEWSSKIMCQIFFHFVKTADDGEWNSEIRKPFTAWKNFVSRLHSTPAEQAGLKAV